MPELQLSTPSPVGAVRGNGVPALQCMPIPRGYDFTRAAALPEVLFTSWNNVILLGRLAEGESILVQGGFDAKLTFDVLAKFGVTQPGESLPPIEQTPDVKRAATELAQSELAWKRAK